MTEAELLEAVTAICDEASPTLVWLHIADARRPETGGPWRNGFPDLIIVGQYRMIMRELKGDGGQLRARQNAWLTWLCQGGADADLWIPADLRDGTINAQLELLNQPRPGQVPDTPEEARLRKLYLPRLVMDQHGSSLTCQP